MRVRNVVLFFALFLLLFLIFAQLAAKAHPRFDPRFPIGISSGEEMYMSYCAECHGRDGKGGRPSAIFGAPVPDLTTLAKRNQGRFPYGVVRDAIRGEEHRGAYGPGTMPPWGYLFRYVGGGSRLEVETRINRLADYIRSLQEPVEER